MSQPWGGPDGVCKRCGSADVNPADEGSFPSCNECGNVEYDEETLNLMAEVRREYQEAKIQCWPDLVLSYRDWKRMRGERQD